MHRWDNSQEYLETGPDWGDDCQANYPDTTVRWTVERSVPGSPVCGVAFSDPLGLAQRAQYSILSWSKVSFLKVNSAWDTSDESGREY